MTTQDYICTYCNIAFAESERGIAWSRGEIDLCPRCGQNEGLLMSGETPDDEWEKALANILIQTKPK